MDSGKEKQEQDTQHTNTNGTNIANTIENSTAGLREQVVEALKTVQDPEIHINIVDLGLVYRVEISDNNTKIEVEFTLTTPGCPLADVIEDDIKKACQSVIPEANVLTTLVWTPMWNVDFMSEDARLELGFPI